MTPAPRVVTGKCAACGGSHTLKYAEGKWSAERCKTFRPEPGVKPQGRLPGLSLEAPVLSKPGLATEVEMAEALNAAGLYGWEPQHEWCEGRKYRADFCFPKQRVLVEVIGGAHIAGHGKLETDCERQAIAASRGWLVVTVTKKTIRSGQATEWITRALAAGRESK